jgi:Fur family ferric uptake transcriptional regulator
MSTVYRTLGTLAEAGVLHAFTAGGETRYRACAPGWHCHLVCRRCGAVTEHSADIGDWLERIRAETDFTPDPQQAEVHGVCGRCRRADTHNGDLAG